MTPAHESLIFINPAVIARIEDGSFVPTRKAKPASLNMPDRRDTISPLAVARRCIRYEPSVFTHRREQILTISHHLNSPQKKMLLIAGEQGTGKTSLIRGVVELLSSESQQLLWFDVNRHTDFAEIIQFLIHYITVICSSVSEGFSLPKDNSEPFAQLEALIKQIEDQPLLIVIDNVEYIVDNEYRLNSYPFKEVMNFLLSFGNIKMILAGERLPYADISPNQRAVSEIKLTGLSPEDMIEFIRQRSQSEVDEALLLDLYAKTHGAPWLTKILLYLYQHQNSPAFYEQLHGMMQKEAAPAAVTRFIVSHLDDTEKQLLQTMALLRHPVNMEALESITRFCHPLFGPAQQGLYENGELHLEQTMAKPVLKMIYPPQEVLKHIKNRDDGEIGFKPWFELYRQIRKVIYNSLNKDERDRLHNLLQDFYMNERNKNPDERLTHLHSRALLGEARFHSQSARKRTAPATRVQVSAPDVDEKPETVVDEKGEEWLESKAYLYRHVKPLTKESYLSLDDYRKIEIPGGEPSGEETIALPPTDDDMWTDVPLSDEERSLLFGAPIEQGEPLVISEQAISEEEPPMLQLAPPKDETDTPQPLPESLRVKKQDADKRQDLKEIAEAFYSREPVDEAEQALQVQLAEAVTQRNKPALAQLLLKLAEYRTSRGLYHSAEECLDKVLALEPSLEPALMADIHRLRGAIKQETYRHNEALHELKQALKYLGLLSVPDKEKLGAVWQDVAEIHAYRGQSKDAIQAFEKAIEAFSSAITGNAEKSRMHLAECHFQLAGVYDDEDRLEEALAHYKKSLAIDEELGHEESCASTLANLGHVHAALGNMTDAVHSFQRSLQLDRKTGNPEGQIRTLDAMAQLMPPQAEGYYQQALAIAMTENNPLWQASVYLKLGNLHYREDRVADALTYYQRALSSGQQELSEESLALLNSKIAEVERVL